jgi:Protein of unknown function (DUF4012)
VRLGSANDDLTNPKRLPVDLGADYRGLYGRTPPYWVNGNASPHFPDAGRIWTSMWKQQFGQQLDGVIATDPVALSHILEATGPALLANGSTITTITADNAVALTMKDVYERYPTAAENSVRDAYLQKIAGAVVIKLLSGAASPQAVVDQLATAATERRLLVYSTHPADQQLLEQTSLAGAIPRTRRPFAGVVVNNYSGNKLDYYLGRTLAYVRSACPTSDGRFESRITVTLTNDAPSRGLPPYVDQQLDPQNYNGNPPHGASTSLVQVYSTGGTQLLSASLDGSDLLMSVGAEQGKSVFHSNVSLLAGQSRTLVLRLSEPQAQGRPRLMTPQPLVRPLTQTARVTPCGTGL